MEYIEHNGDVLTINCKKELSKDKTIEFIMKFYQCNKKEAENIYYKNLKLSNNTFDKFID